MKRKIISKVGIMFLAASLCISGIYIPASAAETRTEYRYHRYKDDSGHTSICPYYGNWRYNTSSMQVEYSEWMEEPLEVDNGKYSCYTHVYQGKSCDKAGCIDKSVDTDRYKDDDGTYWFYQETRVVEVAPVVTPTPKPTAVPTATPTVKPTAAPTAAPTATPTVRPTAAPTATPTVKPTAAPTATPTVKPTAAPTATPTVKPTAAPTATPTVKPTAAPTATPTVRPTAAPTATPTVKPTAAPTATPTVKPTAIPIPMNIEVQELPKEENSVWDEIGVGLLEYAIDIFGCVMDSVDPSQHLEVVKSILSNKETIKGLLKAGVLQQIEDEDILNQLLEVVGNVKGIEGNGDIPIDELGEIANLLYVATEKQPELGEYIWSKLLETSPRLVMKVVIKACGKTIPMLDLVLAVFEESAGRFWALGEALSDYDDAIGEVEDSLRNRYDNLVFHDQKFSHKIMMLALEDKENGTMAHVDEIKECESTMNEIRNDIIKSIEDTLTFWFRLFHPIRTKNLEAIISELNDLDFDYMQYYLKAMEN